MASNKFFTIMVVPEKSNRVARLVVPSYIFKGGILTIAFLGVVAAIMVLDYANVMNQINENKQLKVENRELRQSVQVFKNKMVSQENTLDRVKTFVTKLRIITNIEDTSATSAPALQPTFKDTPAAPPADQPVKEPPAAPKAKHTSLEPDTDVAPTNAVAQGEGASEETATDVPAGGGPEAPGLGRMQSPAEAAKARRMTLLASLMVETPESLTLSDAGGSLYVKKEFEKLDAAYEEVNKFALATEQETQDILERLGEKRAQLASTPTRIPTYGYITSDYGVRISPYDGRRKMHEGIDIANRYGSDIIATADGVVVFSGVKPGYGKLVIVDHGNGLETRYAHASRLYVNRLDHVRRGQRLAAVGNTGHSTGPHCHYEVHAGGLPVDPCWYILDQPALCQSR